MSRAVRWHAGLWCVLSLMLLVAMGHAIAISGYDAGDIASNSILVQYAKHFALLKGNYSRAGFNHPGPMILYVLTMGEVVFHDLLGITSPVGGQFVATALSEAAWLTVSAWLVGRIGLDRLTSVLFLAGYALFALMLDHSVLGGLWFPHLYLTPFGCFVLACGALVAGEAVAIWPLSVAWGYLAEGHASFFAVCGVAFAASCVAHVALVIFGRVRPMGVGTAVKAAIVLASVLALFVAPFVARILTEPASPLAAYIAFGRQTEPHTLGSALSYLAQYWGSSGVYRAAAVLAVGWLALQAGRSIVAASILATAGAATAAALLYAIHGVDNYQLGYIELFYGAVPSIVVGAAIAVATAEARRRIPVQAVLTAVAASLALIAVARQTEAAGNFDVPYVPELSADFDRVTGGPAVLDLPPGQAWADLQGIMLAVEAYRLRRGAARLCIGEGSYVSYSTELLCTPDEIARERHVRLDVASATPPGRHGAPR